MEAEEYFCVRLTRLSDFAYLELVVHAGGVEMVDWWAGVGGFDLAALMPFLAGISFEGGFPAPPDGWEFEVLDEAELGDDACEVLAELEAAQELRDLGRPLHA